ncbi:uncharacterized protein METZ01_LOCUS324448, partial [marine metagenome]
KNYKSYTMTPVQYRTRLKHKFQNKLRKRNWV